MFLYYALLTLYVLICLLLLVVVLLQQGKGGDIAAAFGGSSSQTAFGARAGATVLTRATTIFGALFLLGAFGLTLMSRSAGGGSLLKGIAGPPPSATPALPTLPLNVPTTSAPAAAPATGTAPAAGSAATPAVGSGPSAVDATKAAAEAPKKMPAEKPLPAGSGTPTPQPAPGR